MSDAAAEQGIDAPPEDGTQKDGGWKPPSDGSWLPKVRVDEMVNSAKGEAARVAEEAARLRAEVEALKAAKVEAAAPKPLTRAELKSLVEDGKITQEAADTAWDQQLLKAAEIGAIKAANSAVEEQKREGAVKQQLAEYKQLVPAAYENGTKERARAEKEFNKLVELGFPNNLATEVAAMRATFGDPEAIKAARSTGKNGPGESHAEVGGGDRPGGNGADADGKPKGLTPRQDAHYSNLISRGVMKDWKAVAEELKFAKAK